MMSHSPYLPNDLKEYIKKNKIEETITNMVNELLRGKYDEPYSFMIQKLEENNPLDVKIISVKAIEVLNNEMIPTVQVSLNILMGDVLPYKNFAKLIFTMSYKLKEYHVPLPVSFSPTLDNTPHILYDGDAQRFGGKGLQKACEVINTSISKIISGQSCLNQGKVDSFLVSYYEENQKNCLNVIQPISHSIPHLAAKFLNISTTKYLMQSLSVPEDQKHIPKLFVNALQGSKVVNSKCKIYKFLFILEDMKDSLGGLNKVQSIISLIKKAICSSKLGEAALKFFADGTFICHLDTINDNLKVVEEAIHQSGFKESVSLGIVWQADNFYVPEQKKYELENPKQLLDTDQLIEFYWKMCTDKPIISYLEDPIQSEDRAGWIKLVDKFKGSKVKLGTRKLYSNLEKAKQQLDIAGEGSLSPEERTEQEKTKIYLDYSFYRLGDFRTLSEFIELWKYFSSKNKKKINMIISDTLNESCDNTFLELSFALSDSSVCLGPPVKYEKLLKYNKFIELTTL